MIAQMEAEAQANNVQPPEQRTSAIQFDIADAMATLDRLGSENTHPELAKYLVRFASGAIKQYIQSMHDTITGMSERIGELTQAAQYYSNELSKHQGNNKDIIDGNTEEVATAEPEVAAPGLSPQEAARVLASGGATVKRTEDGYEHGN